MNGIERGIPINNHDDLQRIKYLPERELARFWLDNKKFKKITYEPKPFTKADTAEGKATIPDFEIETEQGYEFYVETTRSLNSWKKGYPEGMGDPKYHQRKKIEQLSYAMDVNITYSVIYGGQLSSLQERYPEYDFFGRSEEEKCNDESGGKSRLQNGE